MAAIIYLLCAITSVGCAVLLARHFWTHRSRLLLLSALCFVGLALNNILVFTDLILLPEYDLSTLRIFIALVAISCLIFGLVWSEERTS